MLIKRKAILFIGGNTESIPGILQAKKLGYITIVSDGNIKSPSKKISDFFIKASIYDYKETISKVLKFNNRVKKIHGVMSLSSDVPYTVAKVAKKLNLRSIPISTAKIFSDKYLMKKNFLKIGVNTPKFLLIKNYKDIKKNILKFSKSILKPVDSRGARGVYVVSKDMVNLDKITNSSMKYSKNKKLILEEFLEGPQLSTESIILNNKVFTVGVSDRNYEYLERFKPNIIENGSDMPSKYQNRYIKEINKMVEIISKKLKIKNGTLKGDLVIHKNKIYAIEFAPRLSGGYFSSKMIPNSSKINLVALSMRIQMQEKLKLNIKKENKNSYVTQRFIFPKPGKVKNIVIPKNLEKHKNVILFECKLKKGTIIKKITNHTDRVGQIIVKEVTKKKAIGLANKLCKSIKINI